MSDDVPRAEAAVGRLSLDEQQLVERCLEAVVHGPYLDDDDEFETVMGIARADVAATLDAWPEPAPHAQNFMAVSNAMNNLLGYPHRQWSQLARELGATEHEVAEALASWRREAY